jgi:hypothetical protein
MMLAADVGWVAVVPVGALVFTVASFWWIWLRLGRLTVAPPDTYASAVTGAQLRIRFPLVIYNTGARAIIVENLRLVVEGHDLEWISVRRTIRPMPDDILDFAAPFPIAGREARQIFVEFGEDPPPWRPELGASYAVKIERKIGDRWKALAEFTWWAPKNDLGSYIAHRSPPGAGSSGNE